MKEYAAGMKALLLLVAWLLVSGSGAVQPATAPTAEALPNSCTAGEEHASVFTPYALASGRPAWAPLELIWGQLQYRSALESILLDGDSTARNRAALALGLIGAQESRERLATTMTQAENDIRPWAGLALCYLGDPRGANEARRLLTTGEPWVRYYAVVGLWRLDAPEARSLLKKSYPTQEPFVQAIISQALHSAPWQPPSRAQTRQTTFTLTPNQLWTEMASQLDLLCDYWWHQGDYEQCCRIMETAIFFCPQRVDLYDNIAWLQWSLGHDEVAVRTLNRGLSNNPGSWHAHFNLGWHYFNTKRYSEALPHLQAAATDSNEWCEPMHLYAHTLERLSRGQEALRVWEDCVERFPEDVVGKRNLERVRQRYSGSQ